MTTIPSYPVPTDFRNLDADFVFGMLQLTQESKERLILDPPAWIKKHYQLHPDWIVEAHHATIAFGPALTSAQFGSWIIQRIHQHFPVIVQGIGVADDIIALAVAPSFPCANQHPHITLIRHPDTKPVKSNQIQQWSFLDKNDYLILDATVELHPRLRRI